MLNNKGSRVIHKNPLCLEVCTSADELKRAKQKVFDNTIKTMETVIKVNEYKSEYITEKGLAGKMDISPVGYINGWREDITGDRNSIEVLEKIKEIDINKIQLVEPFKKFNTEPVQMADGKFNYFSAYFIPIQQELQKQGLICLDARIMQALLDNQHVIPQGWSKLFQRNHNNSSPHPLYFLGSIFSRIERGWCIAADEYERGFLHRDYAAYIDQTYRGKWEASLQSHEHGCSDRAIFAAIEINHGLV